MNNRLPLMNSSQSVDKKPNNYSNLLSLPREPRMQLKTSSQGTDHSQLNDTFIKLNTSGSIQSKI